MLYSIQYLRAVAAVLVVVCHAVHKQGQLSGTGAIWEFGGSGVDLFFIISGFIMCHVTAHRSTTPFEFLRARALRILPFYWTLTLLALVVFVVAPDVVNSSGGRTTVVNSFALIPTGDKFLIQTGWSLSYEFLFYFIFAASLLLTQVNRLTFVAASIVLLVMLGAIVAPANPTIHFATGPLLLEFLMGVGAYLYVRRYGSNVAISATVLVIGLTALACVAYFNYSHLRVVAYGLPYLLCFAALVSFEGPLRTSLDNPIARAMKLVGDASYSMYLSHPFALAAGGLAIKHLHLPNLGGANTFALVAASIALGIACYFFIELPLTRWANIVIRRVPATVTR